MIWPREVVFIKKRREPSADPCGTPVDRKLCFNSFCGIKNIVFIKPCGGVTFFLSAQFPDSLEPTRRANNQPPWTFEWSLYRVRRCLVWVGWRGRFGDSPELFMVGLIKGHQKMRTAEWVYLLSLNSIFLLLTSVQFHWKIQPWSTVAFFLRRQKVIKKSNFENRFDFSEQSKITDKTLSFSNCQNIFSIKM